MDQNFEKYVQRRLAQSGAMTPGQKLEVIRSLMEEAQEGKVPVGENAVARLPLDNPAVQAVLRGEEVSMGGTVVKNDKGFKGLSDRRVAIGLMVGSVLMMILTIVFSGKLLNAAPEPTPTVLPTETALPTFTPLPPPTQIPATPIPPPTATAAFSLGVGGPAENSRDPASIEVSGRLFIVTRGLVDEKTGKWTPVGPEWLEGTEVRRVFAVQYSAVQDLPVETGDMVRVRTRGGAVLEYKVREVMHLMANQIETFVSLRPSVVIFIPVDGGGDVNTAEKIAILAEAPLAVSSSVSSDTAASAYIHAVTNSAVNLRKDPGLNTEVIQGLVPGTALAVSNYPPVTVNDVNWIYVAVISSNSTNGWIYGWLAVEYITYQ